MDDTIKESLDGFEALWRRVRCPGEPSAHAHSPEEALLDLVRREASAAAYTAALAGTFRGDSRALLQRHAAQARAHLRRLRAEYFIATGVAAGVKEDRRAPDARLTALRTVLLQARDMAEAYERAADLTDCPELREVFQTFAQDERNRFREIRALVVGSFS